MKFSAGLLISLTLTGALAPEQASITGAQSVETLEPETMRYIPLPATVTLTLGRGKVKELYIKNGHGIKTYFKKNRRAKLIQIGEAPAVILKDTRDFQTIKLKKQLTSIGTTEIEIKIKSYYPGSKFKDLCLAEIATKPMKLRSRRRAHLKKSVAMRGKCSYKF